MALWRRAASTTFALRGRSEGGVNDFTALVFMQQRPPHRSLCAPLLRLLF